MIPCPVPDTGVFTSKYVGTYYGISGVGEGSRTSELYLGSHNIQTHSYTYIRDPWKFWWDSDAPDPATAKPYTRGKNSNLSIYPLTCVERG